GPGGGTGVAGATGAQGVTGPTGSQGAVGATGAAGAVGAAGPAGATGATGGAGAAGAAGAQGAAGATGAQGAQGVAGPTGAAGALGATGPTGAAWTGYAPLVLAGSPTGYWRLGEASGTAAADAGPNLLGGTYSGAYTLGTAGAVVSDSNKAVAFAGGSVDMASPAALNISGTALTIEFWAKGTPGANNYLVSHTDAGSQGYAVYTGGDAAYHFYIGRGGGLHNTGAVSGTWDGAWHHFANVYDGAQMRLYVA